MYILGGSPCRDVNLCAGLQRSWCVEHPRSSAPVVLHNHDIICCAGTAAQPAPVPVLVDTSVSATTEYVQQVLQLFMQPSPHVQMQRGVEPLGEQMPRTINASLMNPYVEQ